MSGRVDQSGFLSTMRQYASLTPRMIPEILNTKMTYIIKGAYQETPKGDKSKIMADLGASIRSSTVDKKGKVRNRYNYTPRPLVYGLINAQRKKQGKPPITGSEMAAEQRKFVSRRLRAVGSLKSGWVKPLLAFARASKESANIQERVGVKAKGEFSLAKPAWRAEATAIYNLTIKKGNQQIIDPRLEAALQKAFDKEEASMKEYIERKLGNEFAKVK